MMGNLVSIVIPTYNEAKNVPVLVRRIDSAMRKAKMAYECIVVDDNSPDKTYDIAKKLSKKYNVRTFLRTKERGLSSAMLYGYKKSKGGIVGWIDADLQHKPELIPDLVRAITDEGYLMSVGSRLTKEAYFLDCKAYCCPADKSQGHNERVLFHQKGCN